MKKFLIPFAALSVLCLCTDAIAASKDKGCDLASLNGIYGFSYQGTVHNPPSPTVYAYVAYTGIAHFDGKGNVSYSLTGSVNGTPKTEEKVTGTYTVNTNCTGSASMSNGSEMAAVALSKKGNVVDAFTLLSTLPGQVVLGSARKLN